MYKQYSFFAQLKFDVAFCFCVCWWVNILKVTLSHFIGAACIQLEYLLTVHPHPVAINQALRYDIQHKLVTGLAGAQESDASREQLLLVLSACEKRFLRLRWVGIHPQSEMLCDSIWELRRMVEMEIESSRTSAARLFDQEMASV